MANYNPETGIRYGTIYLNSLDPEVAQILWMNGTDLSYEAAVEEFKREFTGTYEGDDLEYDLDRALENFEPYIDEPVIEGEYEGVKYRIDWLGGAPIVFCVYSPLVGRFRPTSPCVPGAVDLDNPDTGGIIGYAIPVGWLGDTYEEVESYRSTVWEVDGG